MRTPIYDIVEGFPGALVLIDLDKGKSITNDVEGCLRDLGRIYGDLSGYRIMYKDTQGVYDGIEHEGGKFVRFFSINERDGNEAYKKLMQKTIAPAKAEIEQVLECKDCDSRIFYYKEQYACGAHYICRRCGAEICMPKKMN